MDDPTALLQKLGFSEYEARAYVTLLSRNPLNGYELAKASGIPRPNIYPVLQKLEERQAITPLETTSGIRYVPLPPETLTERLNNHYSQILAQTQHALTAARAKEEGDVIWNLRGYNTVLQQAQTMIESAWGSLVLGLWQPESLALAEATQNAQQRGIEMITLCLQVCPVECGTCRERVYRYQIAPSQANRWLIVVRDDAEMLFANLDQEQAYAMHTRQPNFIQLASWYVRHSIALTAILTEYGEQLNTSLSPQAREALQAVTLGKGDNWLDYMLNLVRQNPQTP
jgi:HTH-type transcriptional regulator, sugar sensing transcriptional regulator